MLTELNGFLISVVCLTTVGVMVYWHVTTGGLWWRYSSGKSLMGLLGIIVVITALASFSIFYGPFAARETIYALTYLLLEVAILLVGSAIVGAQRGRRRRYTQTHDPKENSDG